MKIIVDILGNDNGPEEVVNGIIDSLKKSKSNFIISGPSEIAKKIIVERNADINRFEFIDTDQFISNDDDPARSIRNKKDSSLVLGLNKLNIEGDGFLTSGSTGALVAGGLFVTKRIKNIKRAALITYVPNINKSYTILLDSGAVVDTKPEMLEQFALMGSIVAKNYQKIDNPRVALLNIGIEEGKGDTRSKETYELLKQNPNINFIGNIEARDFLTDKTDVIVTDGFSGNILVKSTEGVASTLFSEIKNTLLQSTIKKIGGALVKSGIKSVAQKYDYRKAGAAVLVGVNKPLFKAHGNSNRLAIEHAIYKVEEFINGNIIDNIKENL